MRIALLIPLLALFAACSTPESWRAVEVEASFAESWGAFADIAATNGYRYDKGETDRGLRVWTSKWREAPAPFRKGARTRLHGRFNRPVDKPDGWLIEFRVQRQSMDNISAGFEAEEEDWDEDGQDSDREDIIFGQLRLRFGQDLGVTPEYERMRR